MFKKLLEWCDDDDEDGDSDDNEAEGTLFNESRDIITGCKTGVIFIMALHPGLFGVTVSHAGQFLLVVGLSLWIFPCLFCEQSLHSSLSEPLFQLPLLDGWPVDVNFATKDDVLPQWLTTNLWLGALWRK